MDMGMTDAQWKDNLRFQLESWEDMKELTLSQPDSAEKERMIKICNRNISRINKGLED